MPKHERNLDASYSVAKSFSFPVKGTASWLQFARNQWPAFASCRQQWVAPLGQQQDYPQFRSSF
jgi:hypothetical protein